jgi:DNA-binding HxlR family transcriptional regulator
MPESAGRIVPDVFDPACGSRRLLALLADRWTVLVVYALADEPRRPADLRRMLATVSPKMLTQTLRGLESNGLVRRAVLRERHPQHVEYALTPLGESLQPVLRELCRWSEEHVLALPADGTVLRGAS